MTTTRHTDSLEAAADMMERGGMDTTDNDHCCPPDDVAEACRDICRMAMALDDAPADVEARLQAFHRRKRRLTAWLWTAAAAACVAAIVAIALTRQTAPNLDSSPIAYTEVRDLKGVTIVGQKGRETVKRLTEPVRSRVFDVMGESPSDVVLTAAVPTGSSYEMLLADGTRVLMHSNSRLVFPSRFTGPKREVRLDGEAYFVVAHDAAKPFVVHGGKVNAVVTGTEFYMKSYGKAGDNVALVNGKLKVKCGGAEMDIAPGQRAEADGEGSLTVRSVDTRPLEYWRDGYLFYDHASLRDIIESIAADNAYFVEYNTTAPLDRELHFVADRTAGIGPVLRALGGITGVSIHVAGRRMVVE